MGVLTPKCYHQLPLTMSLNIITSLCVEGVCPNKTKYLMYGCWGSTDTILSIVFEEQNTILGFVKFSTCFSSPIKHNWLDLQAENTQNKVC